MIEKSDITSRNLIKAEFLNKIIYESKFKILYTYSLKHLH